MNLEEITQETFLEKFRRKTRKLALPLLFATTLGAKCDCITNPEKSNKPPETKMISGPSGSVNTDKVTFKWEGEDEDGSVEKFHYKFTKLDTLVIEDAYTTETEKGFSELTEGKYNFGVAAIDNDEAIDQTPATSAFTIDIQDSIPQLKQEVVLTTALTNEQGRTSFTDNQTEEKITVKVQDSQTKSPINSISIDYLDSKDFKAYYVQDSDKKYLPAVFVYPHNSEKILEVGPVVLEAFINQIIQGKEEHKALYSWKSEVTNAWRDYAYVKTISKDEMLEQREVEYAIFDIAAEFATLITNYNPIPDDYSFSDFIKLLDGWKYFKDGVIAERWDIYHVKGGSKSYNGKTIQFGAEYLDMIPSNIPTLQLNDPKVEGSNVTLTWKGEDKTTYDNLSFFYTSQGFPQKDLTITQGSDPKKADFTYVYKISKNNVVAFQDSTVDNYKIYKNLEDGDYTLEVLVQDEVGNRSNSITKNFKIEGIKPPEPQERPSKIAFVSGEEGNEDIYIINVDGTERVNLTNHPAVDFDPAWSPDGTEIAFASNRNMDNIYSNDPIRDLSFEIYIMNSDGTNVKRLTYSEKKQTTNQQSGPNSVRNTAPAWSPDGTKIAFSSSFHDAGDIDEIYVMNSDGTGLINLTNCAEPPKVILR